MLNGHFGICGLFPVFLGFCAGSVPVSSGNIGRFCGENVWLGVADCMANVDWGRLLGMEEILSNFDYLVTCSYFSWMFEFKDAGSRLKTFEVGTHGKFE